MKDALRVSVIIPVFNGERTIAAAIDSALAQEFEGAAEVIVVNDGSTDGSEEIVRGYGDRITVVTQENRGPAAARNAGVRASHGEYVAFLDADDIWIPGKLRKTLAALDSDRGAAMVYSNALMIDNSGKPLGTTYTPSAEARARDGGSAVGAVEYPAQHGGDEARELRRDRRFPRRVRDRASTMGRQLLHDRRARAGQVRLSRRTGGALSRSGFGGGEPEAAARVEAGEGGSD